MTLPAINGTSARAVFLASGFDHTCAVLDTGVAVCWGSGAFGSLGDGDTANRSAPVGVAGVAASAVVLAAGEHHTCAVLDTGRLLCWGRDDDGQLGNDHRWGSGNSSLPVAVLGVP